MVNKKEKKEKRPRIVVLGGGTGTFTVLSGLKEENCDLAAVVSMADSGGSNRVLRDEFGILPTSDIRQCMVALAQDHGNREVLRELFNYRFYQGTGIAGMTFGNLFMAALTDIYKDQWRAIKETCRLLGVKGQVLPVTLDDAQLVARYENGLQVIGEHFIDEPKHDGRLRIVELEMIPTAKIFEEAKAAIETADLVVIGPGDLYTSLICNLLVKGVKEAIGRCRGKVVYVLNLISRWGQSYRLTAREHVAQVEKYLGPGRLDVVLVHQGTAYPAAVLKRYEEENSFPVEDDLGEGEGYRVARKDLLSPVVVARQEGDVLQRSIIRHDAGKLAKALIEIGQKR